MNTDAAISESSNYYSHSMIAQDHRGALIKARSSCKQGSINSEVAEAIGIREALSWINSQNWTNVEVEADVYLSSKS